MKLRKYFILLLVVPLLVIGVGYGIVKLLNAGAGKIPPFYVTLDRDILLPWQEQALATIHLDFQGVEKRNKKVGKANIVLVMDSSGSMGAGRGSRFEIARQVIGNFVDNFSAGQDTRMGVILFDSNVSRQIPLTNDYDDLKQKLFSFASSGGGTDFLPPLELAYQWLEPSIQAKTQENNFIIFLTDGGADAGGPNRFYREKLLANSVIVFCVGVGKGAMYQNLANVLRDENGNVPPKRVLTCDDPVKLQFVYDQVGEEIGNVIGKQGQMAIPFAHRAFEWQEADFDEELRLKAKKGIFLQPPEEQEAVNFLNWPIIFARNYSYHVPIEAETFGIIKPFYDDIPFHFYDIDGRKVPLETKHIPYLLKITWLLLFLLYLPLLLFLLYWLFNRRKKTEPVPQEQELLVLGDRVKRPGVLPKQHVPERSRIEWIPTLVIGLGRTGRHVLTHLKQNMDDLMAGDEKTVHLLSIDVAAEEVVGAHRDRVPGTIVALDKESEIYLPGEKLRNVKDLVDQYRDNPNIDFDDPLTGLDMKEYGKLPDGILGLNEGTHHNAALARAYLVKELEMDDQSILLQRLNEIIAKLIEDSQDSQYMQVIIAGNTNGGVGGGLMSDMAVLMRRLAENRVPQSVSVEINLCPIDDRCDYNQPGTVPIQNRVLLDELDCLSQAGRIYQPYNLVRKDSLDSSGILRGPLKRKPHNNVYAFARQTQEPEFDLYPEVADSLFFFIERTARIETRQFVESTRLQEGVIRKDQKIESFNFITGRTIMYPTRLTKEYLKILFISDIFSDKIALKGLNAGEDTLSIQSHGTVADLYDRPSTSLIFSQELGRKASLWITLLKGQDITPFLQQPPEDPGQFIYFLQKAFTNLLNEGVYSLTGMEQVVVELMRRCQDVSDRIEPTQENTSGEIGDVISYLKAIKEKLAWWIVQLLGKDQNEGLLKWLRKSRTRLEETRNELLRMNRCRVVLGLDDRTPPKFHFDGLREQWIASWLNSEDTTAIYDRLKERCIWDVIPRDALSPTITFEFLGTRRHLFTTEAELTPKVLEETALISDQFLEKLKEISIIQLLAEYEQKSTDKNYTLQQLAEDFHKDNRSPNLYYIHLLPHHSRIRLSPGEEIYIERLKTELDEIKYPYEQFLYPPSSNQYKIFSLQVSYLLKGNYKQSHSSFKPTHHPELLKKENHLTIRKLFDIDCEKEIPYYYLLFYNRKHFETFSCLWLAGKIFQEPHDRLWKLEINGNKHKLTFMESETVMDAALHFVLSEMLPFVSFNTPEAAAALDVPGGLPPDKERLRQLDEEVGENNTFYCWMKLYLEGGES